MTEKEAIKRVEEFALHHAIGDLPNSAFTVKAFEMAIAALEKQIPKKPILDTIYHQQYYCPNCEDFLVKNNGDKPHHCTCGQAISWSDTD